MQNKNKVLEPYDYETKTDLMLPSIFTESFTAPDNNGVNQIINQFEDISMNYYNYKREKAKLTYNTTKNIYQDPSNIDKESPYDEDILDSTGFMRYRPKLVDAAREDTQTMLIQQNSMYIIGMITTATLLITAIMLATE